MRQITVILALLVAASCSSDDETPQGTIGYVEGFIGGIAADEPRAALIGRDILSAGGSAADAAAAVYFTLAVTMPSSASLGGGGVCVIHDSPSKTTQTIDFLARAPAAIGPAASRPSAVPGNVRGFFALQSKYGRLRWEQIISPAENLARFGNQISRAFAHDLAPLKEALMAERETMRIFGAKDRGGLAGEGDFIVQLDLAAVLGRLRVQGPGDFYNGRFTPQLVAAVNETGGSLSVEDMRRFSPVWRDTVKVKFGNLTAHFAPPPAAAGVVAAEMWAMLVGGGDYEDASPEERPHLLAEAAMRAYADRDGWLGDDGTVSVSVDSLITPERVKGLMAGYRDDRHFPAAQLSPGMKPRPENPAATSFVAVDQDGSAVACTVTMNNPFGTGRIARGTGILLAAAPGKGGRGSVSLGPMLVINHFVNEFHFAAAASGGVTAPTSMINVAAAALLGEPELNEAISQKRVHHGGMPDLTYYEQGMGEQLVQGLTRRGHDVAATPTLGLVNAMNCVKGIPPRPETCQVRSDPRGFGLAVSSD
ncbi:MAG: gamma-glutamyltransferase [Rhodospirillales bacterium]